MLYEVITETAAILAELQADPLYVNLTRKQECFRARLTAKPSTHGDWGKIFQHFGASLKAVSVGCCDTAGTYGPEVPPLENSRAIYAMSWQQALSYNFV